MCERIAVPITHLLPTDGLTLDQSAVVEPFAIGAHAVRRSGLQAGETVLVIGGGPIGLGVMAFARSRGARVIAMDVNEERLTFCGKWAGAEVLIQALNDPLGDILAANGGELPTVVFDATGNQRSMTSAFQYVANGGRLVYVGLVKATIQFDDQEFHKREMTLMGSRNATHEDFMEVMKAIRSGSIDVGPYITHRASFENMIDTFEEWLNPENKVIKAIIEI
ncbi:putative L-galactonate oxidoreductase [compost metagenome]